MAKKQSKKPMPDTDTVKRPKRTGRAFNFYLRPDLWDILESYIEETRPKPSMTSVMEDALELYFRQKGRFPVEDE